MMMVIHSFFVVVACGMWPLPSRNAAEFGFMLLMIIMLFDFPVAMLFWGVFWPNLGGNDLWPKLGESYFLAVVMTFSWFLFVGGLYWFCIGMIIEIILRIKRKIFSS